MKPYLFKLIGPRSTFAVDMTQDERLLMQEHGAYWRQLVDDGVAIVFGLVLDPKGGWGVAIFEVDEESAAHRIATDDPSVKAGLNTFELYPMHTATTRTERQHR